MGEGGATELTRLRGVLSRIRFASDDGAFSVCELEVEGGQAPVTMVGNLLSSRVGESVEVSGRWHDDRRFGRQFKIEHIETVLPSTAEGVEKYLASDLMEGIGPTLAKRIVAHFGEKTLEIIDRSPERIREVEGIGEKRSAQIIRAWEEGRLVHRIMIFLRSHGVSATLAVKIYKRFGAEAVTVIRRNPYRLVEEIRGIGFQTADQIARHMGIGVDSPERLRAGLLHVLEECHGEGHIYLPADEVEEEARRLLGEGVGAMDDAFLSLSLDHKIAIEKRQGEPASVYIERAYRAERGAAAHLNRLIEPSQTSLKEVEEAASKERVERLMRIEEASGLTFAEAQRRAILSVFAHSLVVVTGGPGTGKTTIVRSICRLADEMGRSVGLAAPTGRAARRLSETTDREASTIHRLLEFSFQQGGFQYDEERPLEVDILIVDEASMIDIYLLYALVRAIPTGATLVLVGDIDQLPSVGPGQVLRDLIESGAAQVTALREIFRQAEASPIVVNAHRINQGLMPLDPPRKSGELVEFYTINAPDPQRGQEQILELVTERIPHAFGLDPGDDIQILSPMYRGQMGCDRLNEILQEAFCAGQPEIKRGSRIFRRGDRVMQTRNNYDEEVFNGDVGRVIAVDEEEKELVVDFDGRRVTYKSSQLDQLRLAFAVTVHKAQGSEYRAVIVVVSTQHYVMLQRNLLYTAVTRGRELVIMVGTEKAVQIALGNASASRRYSRLAERVGRGRALLLS